MYTIKTKYQAGILTKKNSNLTNFLAYMIFYCLESKEFKDTFLKQYGKSFTNRKTQIKISTNNTQTT